MGVEWLGKFWYWLTTSRYTQFLEQEIERFKQKELDWNKREQWLMEQVVKKNGGQVLAPPPPAPPVKQQAFKPPRVQAIEDRQKAVYDEAAERARMARAAEAFKQRN